MSDSSISGVSFMTFSRSAGVLAVMNATVSFMDIWEYGTIVLGRIAWVLPQKLHRILFISRVIFPAGVLSFLS